MTSSPSSETPRPTPLTWQDYAGPVLVRWRRILLWSTLIGVVTLLFNFFVLPLYFKTSATLLPDIDKSKLGGLSQLSGLASLAGVNVGTNDPSKLYPTIITSEAVLRSVIEKRYASHRFAHPVTLLEYFELDDKDSLKNFEDAMKTLNGLLTVNYDIKTNVITLTLEMREPQFAADVLNEIIARLDWFMRTRKMSNASEQRKWIDERLGQIADELSSAENALKNFRERNQQVRSPQLLLEQERLMRDVQVKSTIFIELKKQSELAKIEEIKNISVINVLDEARPPAKKERPKRATNAAIMFLLTGLGLSSYEIVKKFYGHRIGEVVSQVKHLVR